MDPAAKEKTALSIGEGFWHFQVMPVGFCNALATFERLMDDVLAGLPWSVCLVYVNDIIVHGRTFFLTIKQPTESVLVFEEGQSKALYFATKLNNWDISSGLPSINVFG